MSHDLAFIGFGVIIPQKDITGGPYDHVGKLDLYVDWIEYAVSAEECGKNKPKQESVYIITHEKTRREIYDCNYGGLDAYSLVYLPLDCMEAFVELEKIVGYQLKPQWILAHYRM